MKQLSLQIKSILTNSILNKRKDFPSIIKSLDLNDYAIGDTQFKNFILEVNECLDIINTCIEKEVLDYLSPEARKQLLGIIDSLKSSSNILFNDKNKEDESINSFINTSTSLLNFIDHYGLYFYLKNIPDFKHKLNELNELKQKTKDLLSDAVKTKENLTSVEELLDKLNKTYSEYDTATSEISKIKELVDACKAQIDDKKKVIEDQYNVINNFYNDIFVNLRDKINDSETGFQFVIDNVKQKFEAIKEYLESSKNDNESIKSIFENIQKKKVIVDNNIIELEKTFSNKPILDEKIKGLNDVFTRGDDYDTKIGTLYKGIIDRKKEIDDLYYKIIGFTEKNEEGKDIIIPGLKIELEEAYSSLKSNLTLLSKELLELKENTLSLYVEFEKRKENEYTATLKKWTAEYKSVLDKIETLLPHALTAGLSYAYSDKKGEEETENEKHAKTFRNAILGLIFVSLIPFTISVISIIKEVPLETVILRVPRLVLAILPLYIPVLWVAYSANRKMNLAKRLIEEYSHKEVLSKTFEGLSREINNIEDKKISEDLRIKLLYNILEVNSENPGKLISDYNKSDHPLMDALDKSVQLTNAVTKLSKMPGFTKMVATLDKKSKKIIKEQGKKAEAGIESLDDDDEENKEQKD